MKRQTLNRLDALDAELASLFAELEPYSDESLNRRPGADRWSAIQVLYHLMMAEGYMNRYIQKKLSFNPQLPKAGPLTALREWGIRQYQYIPFKFKAPKPVAT